LFSFRLLNRNRANCATNSISWKGRRY
jgi:hypothetical protein